MQRGSFEKMGGSGPVEADETMIGGLARCMRKDSKAEKITGTGRAGRELVMGLPDRQGAREAHHEPQTPHAARRSTRANVEPGSEVLTDDLASSAGLEKDYVHQFREPRRRVRPSTPTASRISRVCCSAGLKGTYVSVEPFHLFRYLAEQAFRYNERKGNDADRFVEAAGSVFGRRLTYKELIGDSLAPEIQN